MCHTANEKRPMMGRFLSINGPGWIRTSDLTLIKRAL